MILLAAQIEFGKRGYLETTNKMIAERAGFTAATIYNYYSNKRGLFLDVHENLQRVIIDRLRNAVAPARSFKEAISLILNELIRLRADDKNSAKFQAVVRTEAQRNPEVAEALNDQEWRKLFHELTDLGQRTGEIDPAQSHTVRAVIAVINLGLVHHGADAKPSTHLASMKGLLELLNGTLLRLR